MIKTFIGNTKVSDNLWDLHKLYSTLWPCYISLSTYQYNKQILKFLLLSIVCICVQFSRKK